MSTILFSTKDLATVAASVVCDHPEGDLRLTCLRTVSAVLALYSEANILDFRATYGRRRGTPRPSTKGDILEAAFVVLESFDRAEAIKAARSFLEIAHLNADSFKGPLAESLQIIARALPTASTTEVVES